MDNYKKTKSLKQPAYFLTGIFLLFAISTSAVEKVVISPANSIKTAFLNNFIAFSQWPESIDKNRLKIGVLKNPQIYHQLELLIEDKKISNGIELFQFKSLKDYSSVDVLWVGETDLAEFKIQLASDPIMLIGEGINCWHQNLHVCLIEENDSFRFKIDLYSFQQSNIKISSRVIRLAKEIRNPTE